MQKGGLHVLLEPDCTPCCVIYSSHKMNMCWRCVSLPSDWLKQPTENLPGTETDKSGAEFTVCGWILSHSAVHNLAADQHTRSPHLSTKCVHIRIGTFSMSGMLSKYSIMSPMNHISTIDHISYLFGFKEN